MFPGQTATSMVGGGVKGYPIANEATAISGGVPDALGTTQRLTEQIANELSALEQRLNLVLRPPMPSANGNVENARPTPSPLAGGIRELNERMYVLLGRVQDISARVDL